MISFTAQIRVWREITLDTKNILIIHKSKLETMSSVETIISEIEDEFLKLVRRFGILRGKRIVQESDGLELFKMVVGFQRRLEYHKESVLVFSGRPYFQRTMNQFEALINYFSTKDKLRKLTLSYKEDAYVIEVAVTPGYRTAYIDTMEGVIHEAKELLKRIRSGTQTAISRSVSLIYDFLNEDVRTGLIELYGDLHLLASLVIFPIEEKLKLKDQLATEEFKKVVEFLEIAEQNYSLTPPHLKDTLSNCRNALEEMVTLLLEKIDLKPARRFSMDVGALSKSGLLDVDTKKVVLSIWSYLSMKGSHSYVKIDGKSISDVDFGLEQTYRMISQLLTKYQTYVEAKTSTKQ